LLTLSSASPLQHADETGVRIAGKLQVRMAQPPFVAFAATSPPCASRGIPCWLRWRQSLLVNHCLSLGHLG